MNDAILIKLAKLLLGSLPEAINPKDPKLDSRLLPALKKGQRSGSVGECLVAGMQAAQLLHNGKRYERTLNVLDVVNKMSNSPTTGQRIWAMGFSAATMRFGADIASAWKRVFAYRHQGWHYPVLARTFALNVAFNIGEHPKRAKLAKVARTVFKVPHKNIEHIAGFVERWSESRYAPFVIGITSNEVLSAVSFARSCLGTSRNRQIMDFIDEAEQILADGRLRQWQKTTDFDWQPLCPELIAKISGT